MDLRLSPITNTESAGIILFVGRDNFEWAKKEGHQTRDWQVLPNFLEKRGCDNSKAKIAGKSPL